MNRTARRQRASAEAASAWAATVADGGRVELGLHRARLVRLVALSTGFVAVGGLMLATAQSGEARMVAAACLGFSVLCLVVFVWQLTQTGAQVVVDDRRVEVPRWSLVLPWSSVEGAFVVTVRRSRLVQLVVDPELYEQWFARKSRLHARIARLNLGLLGGVRAFGLPGPLDADEETLARWLSDEAMSRAPR